MKKIFLLIVLLLSITLISAQPPFQQADFIRGLSLRVNEVGFLEKNVGYTVHIHVYNETTGEKLDNTSTSCFIELYNITGTHLLEAQITDFEITDNLGDFELEIEGGNFSTLGNHPWIIECTFDDGGEVQGGFEEGIVVVNGIGKELELNESIFYIVMICAILLMFGIFFTVFILTPYSNVQEKTKDRITVKKVTITKYIKLISLWFSVGLFMWFVTILSGMVNNYIFFSGLSSMISNMALYINLVGYLFSIGMGFCLFILTWRDIVLNQTILKEGEAVIFKQK